MAALVRLLIIDEVHLLNDERGPVIETLVARTQRQVLAALLLTLLMCATVAVQHVPQRHLMAGRFCCTVVLRCVASYSGALSLLIGRD